MRAESARLHAIIDAAGWGKMLRIAVLVRQSRSQSNPFVREFTDRRIVCRLAFIRSIKRQCRAARVVGVGADPGIFVGESPGLNGGASRTLQASVDDIAVHLSLPLQVLLRSLAIGV